MSENDIASSSISDLLVWLSTCGTIGLEHVSFETVPNAGLGCFAKKTFDVDDTIFVIPQICILGISSVMKSSVVQSIISGYVHLKEPCMLTTELLIWLFMCEQRRIHDSHFAPYLRSLDSTPPSPICWSYEIREALNGTNIYQSLTTSDANLQTKLDFLLSLKTAADATVLDIDKDSLMWAWGHYLSRRYPGEFAADLSNSERDTLSTLNLAREQGLENLGSLCPLLDILNHNADEEWLRLEVKDNALHVICNRARAKGSELYSNYGPQSNERLLFAYGFSTKDNVDDAVAVKLTFRLDSDRDDIPSKSGKDALSTDTTTVGGGTYYIKAGGIEGIPPNLWAALSAMLIYDTDTNESSPDSRGHVMTCYGRGQEESQEERVSKVSEQVVEAANVDEESLGEDEEREGQVEVGVEECRLLLQCLRSKLRNLESTEDRCMALLSKFSVTVVDSPKKKARLKVEDESPYYINPRCDFVRYYRAGQAKVLSEAITALEGLIAAEGDDEF